MTLLTAKDKAFITGNMREVILSGGQAGIRYTPDPDAENLYGKDSVQYAAGKTIPLEMQVIPAETLTKMGADAVINILPDQELNQEDRLEISGAMYKVLSIEDQNCFGVVSHKTVKLVKHHVS